MSVKTLKPEFWFGDIVYVRNDEEQTPGIVTDIEYNGNANHPKYHVQRNGFTNPFYNFELSPEKNTLLSMGINEQR